MFITNVFPLIGIIPLLCTLFGIEIDLSFYINDIIYEFLYNIRDQMLYVVKHEIVINGIMFVISCISFIKISMKIIHIYN